MATITDILEELADRTPDLGPVYWVETRPMCAECRDYEVALQGDICEHCQQEWKQAYIVMSLAGRCANGFELDHGRVFHAVERMSNKAMCGTKPGRRSVGWSRELKPVSCPRCLAKLERMTQRARVAAEMASLPKLLQPNG